MFLSTQKSDFNCISMRLDNIMTKFATEKFQNVKFFTNYAKITLIFQICSHYASSKIHMILPLNLNSLN